VVSDSYDNVSIFSIYWKSDSTGSVEDSSLFIQTLSQLKNIKTCQRPLSDDERVCKVGGEVVAGAELQSRSCRLFILHYAGHAIAGCTPDSLIIVPSIGQDLGNGPQIDMSLIKEELKTMSLQSSGLDVLLMINSSCAAIAGQGKKAKGVRVELMATTACKGISNSREDGQTFTQHWCEAFTKLLEIGEPFTCNDIIKVITPNPELEQFPSMFVLHEGWDLPITFHLHSGPIKSTLPAVLTSRTVITAFHIEENSNSSALKQLIDYLSKVPVPITILAALPSSSTLLLLCISMFLQELLILPQAVLVLRES
jgi:hypothetical protein